MEQSLFVISPQVTMAEGIATLSMEMIFTPEEAVHWLAEKVYAPLGMRCDVEVTTKLYQAMRLGITPDDLASNAIIMLRNGRSEEEIIQYMARYSFYEPDQLRQSFSFLQAPLMQVYAFAYFGGKRLMAPLLQGANRYEMYSRLLREQLTPHSLREMQLVSVP